MTKEIKSRIVQIKAKKVPEGYVKTKAGLMPSDWNINKKAKEVFRRHTDKKHDDSLEILAATQENGIVPRSQIKIDIKCSEEGINGYKKVDAGDFVISLRSFQGGIEYSPYDGIVSPAYTVLKAAVPISSEYYKNYFKTEEFISRLNTTIYGIRDGKQIGYEDFGDLIIHNPPLLEQQKIADILARCDKVIALKRAHIEEEKKVKKWLIQKLLDPKSTNVETKRIKDVCYLSTSNLAENTPNDYSFYYIDISCINNGQIIKPTQKIVFKKAPVRARRIFKKNDILMSTVRPYLHAFAIADFDSADYIASTGFTVLCPKQKSYAGIIYHQLFSAALDKQYFSLLVGTNYPALNTSDVALLKVTIPIGEENRIRISNLLFAENKKIILYQKELAVWQQKKKALMQLLLTGIVRVK